MQPNPPNAPILDETPALAASDGPPDAESLPAATAASLVEDTAPSAAKPSRLDPTRYGDWELNGKCVDF